VLTIIGCGNLNRSDDGIGALIAQRLIARLERHPVPGVQAFDCGTAGMEVMFKARGSDALIIVDASATGADPGTLYRVPGEVVAATNHSSYSLHDFRWDHAIGTGRQIFGDDFPEDVCVWLIEAESTGFGLEVSDVVRQAADTAYQRILEQVAEYAARRHANAPEPELTISKGVVHLPLEVYETYFDGRDGAVVFVREESSHLVLLPVEQIAGGLLLKQRNPRGDRAIVVAELLRNHGWDDWGTYTLRATWEESLGALAIQMPERTP